VSERRTRCAADGKVRFASPEEATKRLLEIQADPPPGKKIPIRSYPCTFCKGWHLTSQERQYR